MPKTTRIGEVNLTAEYQEAGFVRVTSSEGDCKVMTDAEWIAWTNEVRTLGGWVA